MSPSYHSKGASIERSTFNSRGDFSKLQYLHNLLFDARCLCFVLFVSAIVMKKSNTMLLMCENTTM